MTVIGLVQVLDRTILGHSFTDRTLPAQREFFIQ